MQSVRLEENAINVNRVPPPIQIYKFFWTTKGFCGAQRRVALTSLRVEHMGERATIRGSLEWYSSAFVSVDTVRDKKSIIENAFSVRLA